jgi:hypothetical protein
MKKLFIVIMFIAGCSANPGVAQATPTPPSLYKGHGVISTYSGLEPTVIVENGLVRVWYTAMNYLSSAYAPGGASYGTTIYPFNNTHVAYMEMDALVFASAIQNGTALTWSNQGSCVTDLYHTFIAKGPDGKYNMLGVTASSGSTVMDWYQSTTGAPGTWSLMQVNIINFGTGYATGNCSFNWNGSSWDVYIEYANWSLWPTWRNSYWNGASLGGLARMDSNIAPAMRAGDGRQTSMGHVLPQQYNGKWVHFSHDATNPDQVVPTDLAFWSSTQKASGWTRSQWVIQLSTIQDWNGDVTKPFNSDSQIADPVIFEINGRTFMMYETIWKELYDIPSLSVAWWGASLSTVIGNYLGIAPPTGTPVYINTRQGTKPLSLYGSHQGVAIPTVSGLQYPSVQDATDDAAGAIRIKPGKSLVLQ